MKTRKLLAFVVIVCLLLPMQHARAQGFGWEFRIFEWGPLEVVFDAGIKIGFRNSIIGRILTGIAIADAVLGIFSVVSSYGASSSPVENSENPQRLSVESVSYPVKYEPPKPPEPTIIARIDADQVMKGDVFSLKFSDLISEGKILLSGGAYMIVESDGKLVFHNFGFEGYMLYHYNKSLSIWRSDGGQPLIVFRMGENNRLEVLKEQSSEATEILRKLLEAS